MLPFPQADNRCVPRTGVPETGVYGWWADLDPGASGARVSTFRVGSDRFVIEFANVPAVGVAHPYTVSFQIVLHQNGSVGLNFAETPVFEAAPDRYTVGVETYDALFYALVSCVTDTLILGEQPTSEQSLLIRPKDIF